MATALDLIFRPGIEVRVLAGSLEQASRMHAHLRGLFERDEVRDLVKGRASERRLELVNGSRAEVLSSSQASVRGTRVQRLRCDEVELFDPAVWEAAQLTTRSRRCGGVWVRGTIECLSTLHVPQGLMQRLVDEGRAGKRALFRWGVLDVLARCGPERACLPVAVPAAVPAAVTVEGTVAPGGQGSGGGCVLWAECGGRAKQRSGNETGEGLGHLEVSDAAEMKGRVSSSTWAAEMMCGRPRREDAVLPEFDPDVHVRSFRGGEGGGGVWVAGMDFGIASPAVIVWARVGEDGVVWVTGESVKRGRVVSEHAAELASGEGRPRVAWVGVDPAGQARSEQTGESAVGVLRKAGLEVRATRVPTARGLELLRARLSPASGGVRLLIDPSCVGLIGSVGRYHYDARGEPRKDGADHAVDALRYLVQNLDGSSGEAGRWGSYA
ncbi:MAG: hypothetical protein HRU70_08925 [Phycisphaeraceae bacterium]|nr:MAG: hypothetical protein HRU70_08925 [Phycisphaeraceae bacterium]